MRFAEAMELVRQGKVVSRRKWGGRESLCIPEKKSVPVRYYHAGCINRDTSLLELLFEPTERDDGMRYINESQSPSWDDMCANDWHETIFLG